MTRGDFIPLPGNITFADLDLHTGYVPYGKESEDNTDFQIFGSAEVFFKMINITQQLVCNVDHYRQVERKAQRQGGLESAQRMIWKDLHIPVEQLKSSSFP
jgi:hypothetical protein